MGKVSGWFNILLSSLSLIMLVKQGWDFGIAEPLRLILDWYQHAIDFALGWADLPLKAALRHVADMIGIELHLYPHWKHIFVPMWLYFIADSRINWRRERKDSAIAIAVWGGLVAFISSVASGTVALDAPNMLAIIFPVAGFFVYDLGTSLWDATVYGFGKQSWWKTFRYYALSFALSNALMGGVIILVGLLGKQINLPNLNLLLLIVLVVSLAVRNISLSLWVLIFHPRKEGQTRRDRFLSLATWRHGLVILQSVGVAAFLIASNAGLVLIGL